MRISTSWLTTVVMAAVVHGTPSLLWTPGMTLWANPGPDTHLPSQSVARPNEDEMTKDFMSILRWMFKCRGYVIRVVGIPQSQNW